MPQPDPSALTPEEQRFLKQGMKTLEHAGRVIDAWMQELGASFLSVQWPEKHSRPSPSRSPSP
ncbi:MAG: hypothetical protein Q7T01_00230 [bacterium]|nr:hypothetical protein [bacterium]